MLILPLKSTIIVKNYEVERSFARAYEELSSNLFVTNGTAEYVEKMMTLGHKVNLYSFDYFNPKSYSIFSLILPFKGAIALHKFELYF
uniref:Glucuronosyltransferase n=1 Tax=Elaeophora elaphi TaxID=1147741 RepID=A0A0R3RL67_9BILA